MRRNRHKAGSGADTASVEAAFAALPRLDILLNNAGVAHVGNLLQTSPSDPDRLYRVKVRGVYHRPHCGPPAPRSAPPPVARR